LAVGLGYRKEIIWTKEMLSWPIEWSALHGIAQIVTPVFRISTRTDLTARKYTVRYHGSSLPYEGANGMMFPFIRDPYWSNPNMWTSNGFNSKSAMEESHNGILGATLSLTPNQVFDFGCGNGALLGKIRGIYPQAELFGIEIDPKRCEEGAKLHAVRIPKRIHFHNTGIRDFFYEWIDEGSVGIISVQRFLEEDLSEFVKKSKIKKWILYAYSDTKFFVPECFLKYRILHQFKDDSVHLIVVEK
jgi:SAM-dependent methyltransferase